MERNGTEHNGHPVAVVGTGTPAPGGVPAPGARRPDPEAAAEPQNPPPFTLEGWFILHDFRRLDWRRWKALDPARRAQIAREAAEFLRHVADAADTGEGTSALYRVVGHKADLLWLHFRPALADLGDLEAALSRTALGDYLEPVYSYVSVTELSFYRSGPAGPERDVAGEPFVRARLYPAIPPARHACFYPMNKKRSGADNWYILPFEERGRLMHSHGLIGRKYAGRVTQIISGSVGLDDWEWGVTLFADDPVDFKRVVYEMRFDEASARYGEFGPFYVGVRTEPDDLVRFLCPETASGSGPADR